MDELHQKNHFQELTSSGKLRGEYYTPDELVALMLEGLHLTPHHRVLDPACGDGRFLRGAVAAIARRFRGADPRALAKHWAGRLIGFDIDPAAVAATRTDLRDAFAEHLGVEISPDCLNVHPVDIFQCSPLPRLLRALEIPRLHSDERLIVIGNPPYVEAKRLPRQGKETLRERFPEAVAGAPDLYLYFLHVCLHWLRPVDTLAFVLPNKLLVNANARRIREQLLNEQRLRGLWFATQAALFPEAAVYPIVLFAGGAREGAPEEVETTQITRTPAGEVVQGERIAVGPRWYRQTAARAFFPPPHTPLLQAALEQMLGRPEHERLGRVLDIRWAVSFHRAGLREEYVLPHPPDDPSARRFIGGGPFSGNGEVTRYGLQWAGWWIRYDEAELKARKNPLPDVSLFERPKVVICQNGRTLRAAYDDQAFVLKDTFLCGSIPDLDHPLCRHPRALVGLLSSRAVHFFYSHVFYGGHVNGGYLHFLRSFLVDIPVGRWTDEIARTVAELVQRRETAVTPAECGRLEEEIEALVSEALGLSVEQRVAIAAWAAGDANWRLRERTRVPRSSLQGVPGEHRATEVTATETPSRPSSTPESAKADLAPLLP